MERFAYTWIIIFNSNCHIQILVIDLLLMFHHMVSKTVRYLELLLEHRYDEYFFVVYVFFSITLLSLIRL